MIKQRNYQELHKDFLAPPAKYRMIPFVRMDGDISDEETINQMLAHIKKAGYGGIVPVPVCRESETIRPTTPAPGTEEYYEAYGRLLEKAKKLDLQVVFYDDVDAPSGVLQGAVVEKYPDARAQVLIMREYECTAGEMTRRKLDTSGVTVSLVAYEIDRGDLIDLREDVMGDTLVWDTPDGNWNILQFLVCPNERDQCVNYLNYKASMRFVEMSYKAFTDHFSQYIGDVVKMTWYDDLQYLAPNRRMWSVDFNEQFRKMFGYDPAPYYPALFYDVGPKTEYYTACFMKCRAEMFAEGFFRAVSDFTAKFGLVCTGHVSESKTAATSNLFGDVMLAQKYAGAAGLDMIHAYMYGFNGLKLVSSAAYNYEKEIVACEMYKYYAKLDGDILFREAMNAYVRGVNLIMPDVMQLSGDETFNHQVTLSNPDYKDVLPKFTDFGTRCQAMLQGGTHVCNIAMLNPIVSMHSKVFLYDQKEREFEFPPVYRFADYISDINSVMNYCGRDLTVLHPDVFMEHSRTENGVLYIDNALNPESYQILILPAMAITSIRVLRVVRDFFDCGGKILATSQLPFQVLEDNEEYKAEGKEILNHVFGVCTDETNYVSDYEMRENDKGGMALYLRSSMTDLDGTEYVEANRINEALWKFQVPVDAVFENLPRIAQSGILALNLIAFTNSGATNGIRSGGVFNYIHKRHEDCDVYYVSNTTIRDYKGRVFLNGGYSVEEWNPHTAKTRVLTVRFGYVGGELYTVLDGEIPSDSSVFYVCRPETRVLEKKEILSFETFAELRRYCETLDGKKATISKKPRLFRW